MTDEYPRLISPIGKDIEAQQKLTLPAIHRGQKRIKAWAWRNSESLALKVTIRFPDRDRGKVVLPFTLWEIKPGCFQWMQKDLPAPRPLYGLDRLGSNANAPVIVCEGEKACDAAQKIFSSHVAVTSGSATSAKSTDWEPLRGRHVKIWPDHDKQGISYAHDVLLCALDIVASIAVVQIPKHFPEKWDLADSLPIGWSVDKLLNLLDGAEIHPNCNADPGPGAARVATLALAARATAEAPIWPAPQPLMATYGIRPYPVDVLPQSINAAVKEVHSFVQAPLAMVASSALTAVSTAVQGLVDIARDIKLTGPSSLFFLTIADSGERKSSCDGYFTKALKKYEFDQAMAMAPAVKAYAAAMEAWDSKISGVKDAIRKAARDGDPTDGAESKLADLERDKPEAPRVPRVIYGDATPEALRYGLACQWPSGAIISSEAGIVFGSHGMGSDSIMRNLATINQLWDGGEIPTDRRSKESFTVRGTRLTMGLQIQEPTLREFLLKSGTLARGSGFLARFLLAWPESTQGTRMFRHSSASWPHLDNFDRRLTDLLNRPLPMTPSGTLTPTLLTFSAEANQAWVGFHDRVERELGDGQGLQDIRDVASKVADNAARLAATIHVFEHGDADPVDSECFHAAAEIIEWHLLEARRIFGELALPPELAKANHLERWVVAACLRKGNGVNRLPIKEIQQYGPSRMRRKADLDQAVSELTVMGRARFVMDGRAKFIEVNPALL